MATDTLGTLACPSCSATPQADCTVYNCTVTLSTPGYSRPYPPQLPGFQQDSDPGNDKSLAVLFQKVVARRLEIEEADILSTYLFSPFFIDC